MSARPEDVAALTRRERLREALERVAEAAIDALDALDGPFDGLEDDEAEVFAGDEW